MDEIFKCNHSNKRAVLSCGNVYYTVYRKVVLTFESLDEIFKYDHSNERAVLSCGAVYLLYKVVLIFTSKDEI